MIKEQNTRNVFLNLIREYTYLVTVLAFSIEFPVLAHFSSELVHVWGTWSEIVLDATEILESGLQCVASIVCLLEESGWLEWFHITRIESWSFNLNLSHRSSRVDGFAS